MSRAGSTKLELGARSYRVYPVL